MLAALIEVLIDLFYFVFPQKGSTEVPLLKAPPQAEPLSILTERRSEVLRETAVHGFISAETAVCYTRPVMAFDTSVGVLPYGTKVSVLAREGRFAHIEYGHLSGWVDAHLLTEEAQVVYPHLLSGTVYGSDASETIKIRRLINDECAGGALCMPLQPIEHLLYELLLRTIQVPWHDDRPRMPGHLHTLLRGRRGVRMGIEPKTGSLMEFSGPKRGVVAWVDAVHPDETLVIRSVGKEREGEFLIETISKADWRELRPVFISFE
ncbi:MAG TPA: SH3 domain-containing protein [Candidatus Paceibacterota bacterium]